MYGEVGRGMIMTDRMVAQREFVSVCGQDGGPEISVIGGMGGGSGLERQCGRG